jgi:hypothetical protein
LTQERIDWVRGTPRDALLAHAKWREAIARADAGDTAPLIELFRSEEILGPETRDLLANLLARHNLRKLKGGQQTPAYRVPPAEAHLRMQAAGVRYWRKKGLSVEDAIRAELREEKREQLEHRLDSTPSDEAIDEMVTDELLDEMVTDDEFTKLENFINGQRGSSRRQEKRRRGT